MRSEWNPGPEAWSKMSRERDEKVLKLIEEGIIEYSNDLEFVKLAKNHTTRYNIISRLRKRGEIKTVRGGRGGKFPPLKLIYVGNDGADIYETNKS